MERRMYFLVGLMIVTLLVAPAIDAKMYFWTDENGVKHFMNMYYHLTR